MTLPTTERPARLTLLIVAVPGSSRTPGREVLALAHPVPLAWWNVEGAICPPRTVEAVVVTLQAWTADGASCTPQIPRAAFEHAPVADCLLCLRPPPRRNSPGIPPKLLPVLP